MTADSAGETRVAAADDLPAIVDGLEIYFQPVIEIATGRAWAFEALARFRGGSVLPTDEAIASAHRAGFGHELEAACLQAALSRRGELPAGVLLGMNVSPEGLLSSAVGDMWGPDLRGVLVEITEHYLPSSQRAVAEFDRLRERGALIAVDDVGSGYAGLLRLATLRPDVVKLDRSVLSQAREGDAERAVLETMVGFARRIGAKVVGEGVESLDDLTTLLKFDVDYAQGWTIGRPSPHPGAIDPAVIAVCQRARAAALQAADETGTGATWDIREVAATLARATELAGLHLATAQAAAQLGVDVITASVVDDGGVLHAVSSSGAAIDTASYRLADYPASRRVVVTGVAVEVHANDPDADPAEVALLRSLGRTSLLIVPLMIGGHRIGILEFEQHEYRRWTSTDIANARGLATHVGQALARITS